MKVLINCDRYANMDFIFASAVRDSTADRLVISYDIACQWHKNLPTRMDTMTPEYRLELDNYDIDYVIPKFHIAAHGSSCQSRFSLNFRPHMGRTDGENIERGMGVVEPRITQYSGDGSRCASGRT